MDLTNFYSIVVFDSFNCLLDNDSQVCIFGSYYAFPISAGVCNYPTEQLSVDSFTGMKVFVDLCQKDVSDSGSLLDLTADIVSSYVCIPCRFTSKILIYGDLQCSLRCEFCPAVFVVNVFRTDNKSGQTLEMQKNFQFAGDFLRIHSNNPREPPRMGGIFKAVLEQKRQFNDW